MLEAYEVALNRHLAAIDREDSRDAAIDKRMEQSMSVGEAYHPYQACNFIEGLEEGRRAILNIALEHLESGRFAEGGKLLVEVANDYWASIARQDAEYEVDNPDEDFDEPDRD